ncbi:MAG: DUF3108 domain-containing protein [Bacteroidales bacterium]|nr:DUF3108 domain-containing protein [Bacteroidales bacterium]MCM1146599.1 DUF3108 domain-containing protein [Bacteroidales bacterium]MCM1205991.1 DUF3108 domain-containing protein [Bacillota bacterium]MCM1510128.1 DUF3108 domain-containing protein [Clostridium sp.]
MRRYALLLIMILPSLLCHAQAFRGGETLEYKMYFNWQFVWLNAGTATMTIREQDYQGRKAFRCALTTRSSQKIDRYFRMRDTLLCYTTPECLPLYYRKGASEGKRYYVDELLYSYDNGIQVTMRELTSNGERLQHQHRFPKPVYDMLSIFLKARSYNTDGWKKGYTIVFPMAAGSGVKNAKLKYQGKKVIKAEDGNRYNCLQLTYMEPDGKKEKEIVRFFVTDDKNHIPIRLDMFLNFGIAKAFLKSMKGVKNPVTARL